MDVLVIDNHNRFRAFYPGCTLPTCGVVTVMRDGSPVTVNAKVVYLADSDIPQLNDWVTIIATQETGRVVALDKDGIYINADGVLVECNDRDVQVIDPPTPLYSLGAQVGRYTIGARRFDGQCWEYALDEQWIDEVKVGQMLAVFEMVQS